MKRIIFNIFFLILLIFALSIIVTKEKNQRLFMALESNDVRYPSLIVYRKAKEGDLEYFKDLKWFNEKPSLSNSAGMNVIHIAVKNQRYSLVKYFIEQKMNFNIIDDGGNYPLILAAKNCDKRMVDMLLPVSDEILKDREGNHWRFYFEKCKK